ncbi:MAG: hypothetical protein S4CHLAM123_04930 [Chlamydiales bacterium]|nr:hypothetical protein [Chlamydiales bacterium]
MKFKYFPNSFQKAFSALKQGVEEEELDQWIPFNQRSLFYYYFDQLKKHSLFFYETEWFQLETLKEDFELHYSLPKQPLQLSRFAVCRLIETELVIETPLSPIQIRFLDETGLLFFKNLSEPFTLDEIEQRCALPKKELLGALLLFYSAKLIQPLEESAALMQWEFHDLYFHARSRRGRHNNPWGGTFRFKSILDPLPAVIEDFSVNQIKLSKLPLNVKLEQAFRERKSMRIHGKHPISKLQLGAFLYHSHCVNLVEGEVDQKRPYPGGGGLYELETNVVIHECAGIERGVYKYNRPNHSLSEISSLNEQAQFLLKEAAECMVVEQIPQVLLIFSARFQRVSWKYQSIAYSLILKNLGALFQTMYLVAAALDLAPCALGGGDSDVFCKLIQSDYLTEASVGEFSLGSKT